MAIIQLFPTSPDQERVSTQNSNNMYLDTRITTTAANLASGAPKGVYATLSALQAAYPSGTTGIYLVTADGKWYYWSGSAWTAGGVYQSTGLSDGIVTSAKIAAGAVGTTQLADNGITAAKIFNGTISLSKLDSALQNTLSNSLKYTQLAGDANIDNLYGSANYGAYYPPHVSAAGTYPPGESALTGILFVFDSGGSWAGQVWIGKKCYYRLNHSTSEAAWDAWSTYDIPDGSITEQKLAEDVLESIDNKIDMYNLTILDDIESASIPSGLYRMTLTTTGTKPSGETSLATTLLFVVQTNSTSGYQIWLGKKCYSRSKQGVLPWSAWSDYTIDDGTITMAKLAADLQNLINGKANKAQEDWITPTLVNGWVSDASYPVKYMIDQFGFVHMRGCVSGGAAGTIVFTLPTGYRSSMRQYFLCGKIDGGGATTGARITMFSSGALYAEVASTSIDLSAVYFKAD